MDQTGAGTERPDTSVRKARRRAGRSRGNGRYGASPWPRLRDILFKDLRPTDLPRNFRQDLKRLYRFYLDEERRAELAAMGRVRRTFKLLGWPLKSFPAQRSPGLRLALFGALVTRLLGHLA